MGISDVCPSLIDWTGHLQSHAFMNAIATHSKIETLNMVPAHSPSQAERTAGQAGGIRSGCSVFLLVMQGSFDKNHTVHTAKRTFVPSGLPDLCEEDIRATLAFAAERERRRFSYL